MSRTPLARHALLRALLAAEVVAPGRNMRAEICSDRLARQQDDLAIRATNH